jgi:hypothetical protein
MTSYPLKEALRFGGIRHMFTMQASLEDMSSEDRHRVLWALLDAGIPEEEVARKKYIEASDFCLQQYLKKDREKGEAS